MHTQGGSPGSAVLGNGWAGSRAAAELAKKPDAGVQVTVITPQEYKKMSERM